MSVIENQSEITVEQRREYLASLEYCQLRAQEIMEQGAIHAISTLLTNGCTESNAMEMIKNLRIGSGLIRDELKHRGQEPLFKKDQTNFN